MILTRLLGESLATANDERFWSEVGAIAKTSAGISVNEDTALNYTAVYRAVSLISSVVATLPIHVYRRISDSERERVADHPLEKLLNVAPNAEMDAVSYRETMQAHILTWGNSYSEIIRLGNMPVMSLEPLSPKQIKPVLEKGRIVYEFKTETGQTQKIPAERIFHLKNLGDGLVGWSPVRRAREAIGLGMAAEQFGSTFFGNGTVLSGLLKHPGRLSEMASKRLRANFEGIHQGTDRAHKVGLLEEGMDWVQLGVEPEAAQFLETRKLQVTEVARIFGIPPHLLGDLERATFSNIEHQGIEFLIYCLRYWLVKWEKTIERSLFTDEDRRQNLYVEHVPDALLRADTKSRFEAYQLGRNGGWLSVNDIRKKENDNGIGPEGDIYLVPANMVSAESVLNPPEPPEPEQPQLPPEPEMQAYRNLLRATLERMLRKESANIRQAAKSPHGFLAWLDRYYHHQEEVMAAALAERKIASRWCQDSRSILLDLTGKVTPSELPEAIELLLTSWPERIKEVLP